MCDASRVPSSDGQCQSHVTLAKEHAVQQHRHQLMDAYALAPAVSQRRDLVVRSEKVIQVRAAKELKHRKVGFGVATRRHGVDKCCARCGGTGAVRRPEEVPSPEIAVDTRAGIPAGTNKRGLWGVEVSSSHTVCHVGEKTSLRGIY